MVSRGLIGAPCPVCHALFDILALQECVGFQHALARLSADTIEDGTGCAWCDQGAVRIAIHECQWKFIRHVDNAVCWDISLPLMASPCGAFPGVVVLAAPGDGGAGADDAPAASLCCPDVMQGALQGLPSFLQVDLVANGIPVEIF